MNELKIGWSEIDITPQKSASLQGQFAERISEYVEKPITATAMALEYGEEQAVLVSVDINGISYNLLDEIRKRLAGNGVGLDTDKVIFSATHTHTAPVYPRYQSTAKCGMKQTFRSLLEEQLPDGCKYVENVNVSANADIISSSEMFELLAERLTKVALSAWEKREKAYITNEFARAAVGQCRRATYSDGSAKMWGDTNTAIFEELEGGSDSGMELLYVFDGNKKISGVVANIACPAQCVQHRLFISPDFWGEVKMHLRSKFGENTYLLGLCGIAGDQCPVDLIRWVEPESDLNDPNIVRNKPPKRKADPSMFDMDGMKKTGKRIAREIIDLYDDGIEIPENLTSFEHKVEKVHFPVRKVTAGDVELAKQRIREYVAAKGGDVNYNDTAFLNGYLGDMMRFQLQEIMDVLEVELHVIKICNIVIATNPFEPFIKYGNQIKARSRAEQTFLVQLANGFEGYIPTERAEKGGHYSGFAASGIVGHDGGDMLVRETLRMINHMFEVKR